MKNQFLKGLLLVAFLLSSVNATFVFDSSGDSMQMGHHVPVDRPAALDIGGCQLFPDNNYWNTPVDDLSVHPSSAAWVNSIGANDEFHMDFGSGTWAGGPIGIPYNVLSGSNYPTVTKYTVDFYYPEESDPGPYPIKTNINLNVDREWGSDHHILTVDTDDCTLYELYDASKSGSEWFAGSGAIWDLSSNALRPNTWTSADAAGLPILPGLARYEEVVAGEINHALRFTASQTAGFIWPARHQTSNAQNGIPPMGARFRLKADYNISGFTPDMQVILRAMKKYGIVLADNGSDWSVSGVPNAGWDNDELHDLDVLKGSNFEAVDTSELMVDYNSGEATLIRNVETYISGVRKQRYNLVNYTTKFSAYSGVSGGPVKVVNINDEPIISSERVIHYYNGVNTSYYEMIGLPLSQISTEYWYPYNTNSGVNTQLRVSNIGNASATFEVRIAGVQVPGSPFTVATNSIWAQNFYNIVGGPVQVKGTNGVPITSTQRFIFTENGVIPTSFAETMGLPAGELDTEYWFPIYNNLSTNSQLRIANAGASTATVDIYMGDVKRGETLSIPANSTQMVSFPGLAAGPVRIVSTGASPMPIVVTERVLFSYAGKLESYYEMMALPAGQLSTEYWYPYNTNSGVNTQLRFGNAGNAPAQVEVRIAGNLVGSYTVPVNSVGNDTYYNVVGGPVQVTSTNGVPITSTQRFIFTTNGVIPTSFSETMGMPLEQLSSEYWFPLYNNLSVNSQLRLAMP